MKKKLPKVIQIVIEESFKFGRATNELNHELEMLTHLFKQKITLYRSLAEHQKKLLNNKLEFCLVKHWLNPPSYSAQNNNGNKPFVALKK